MSLAIWDHTVLPTTRHKWTHPALTPARQAGTRFTYPGGMEGWVDLGDRGYMPRWFPAHRRSPIQVLTQQVYGQESNSLPVGYKSDALTITPPSRNKHCRIWEFYCDEIWLQHALSTAYTVRYFLASNPCVSLVFCAVFFTAQCFGDATVCRLSVCLSVCLSVRLSVRDVEVCFSHNNFTAQ